MSESPELGDCSETKTRMAETPRPVSRSSKDERKRRSVELGFLLVLQTENLISEGQMRYLINLQRKMNLLEIQKSQRLLEKILSSPRSRARSQRNLMETLESTPSLDSKSVLPERRRIGVGYRDKGALRPSHRPRAEFPLQWWSQDLEPALLHVPEEPRWISAEELFGPKQYDHIQEMALIAYARMLNPNLWSEAFLPKGSYPENST